MKRKRLLAGALANTRRSRRRLAHCGVILAAASAVALALAATAAATPSSPLPVGACFGSGAVAACVQAPADATIGSESCQGDADLDQGLAACNAPALQSVGSESCQSPAYLGFPVGTLTAACSDVPALVFVGPGSCTDSAFPTDHSACSADPGLITVATTACNGGNGPAAACSNDEVLSSVGLGSCTALSPTMSVCANDPLLLRVGDQSCRPYLGGFDGLPGSCSDNPGLTSVGDNACNGPDACNTVSGAVGNCQGNTTPVINCDPPVAHPTRDPEANSDGWNKTDVTVTWNWQARIGSAAPSPSCPATSESSGEGQITLTASCTSLDGITGTASVTVQVDKTPPAPALSGISSFITVPATGPDGAIVSWGPVFTDPISGIDDYHCSYSSGSLFPVGRTVVTCTAFDLAGNARITELTVTVLPFITVTTASLPAGTIASPYTATLAASGGTGFVTWSLRADTLPPGLTLNAAGVISGTPTTGGTYTFTVQATDIEGLTAQKQFTVQVAVSVAGLCQLTQADVESSAKFAKLSAKDQKALDQTIQVICNGITAISPKLTAKQKTAAIAAYKASVGLLQTQGWLTAAQASTLKADADQL